MKFMLKRVTLPITACICLLSISSQPVSADSTASLIVNLKCQGGYNIQVWRNRTNNRLTYRSQSPSGNAVSYQGTSRATEGVMQYKFRNGSYEYWVWDGTLDSTNAGTLEVYRNSRLLMRRQCQKT
jgi:hypothetical protein